MTEKFDVIVIGSGMGGLAAASILARLQNKRVLVLEKHYVAGGQTHEFHRNQYSWDVGIHYVGGLAPGEQARKLMDLVTGKQVTWNEMPEVFDRFIYPDLSIDVPKDPHKFAENLIELFPNESQAIHQYVRDLEAANDWYISHFIGAIPDYMAQMPFALRTIGKGKLARMTTQDYLDQNFKDQKLKAVLASQWGDYGLTPDRSSFGLHALVAWGYGAKTGAFFPEGGGRSIAQAVERVVESEGGRIQVDTEVQEILVRDGAAYGVKARQSSGEVCEYHADTIISNAGAELTFCDLVPDQYCRAEREELATFEHGTSAVTLYLGLSESPEKFGIKGENYWIYNSYIHAGTANSVSDLIAGKANYGFLSFPSMKNTQARAHTAEVCAFIDPAEFGEWADRPGAYYLAKENIINALTDLLEKQFPGFSEIIDYKELSTPVTLERFTSRSRGEPYGIPGTPARFDLKSLSPKTKIKNLYLSGSDVCSLGIVGALNGGAAAAASVMGIMGFMRIMIGASIADKKPAPLFAKTKDSSQMVSGTLTGKLEKTSSVFELQITAERDVSFRAGQHTDLLVTENDRRAYSVLSVKNKLVTLVIETNPGGAGSHYVTDLAVGDSVSFSPPKGDFSLNTSDNPVCFISTGTGMVPLMAMLEEYQATTHCDVAPKFLFGIGKGTDNYMPDYFADLAKQVDVTYCLSRESAGWAEFFPGRITTYLNSDQGKKLDYAGTDFYICGNPNMVQDVQTLLRANGARRVFVEFY